MKYWRPQSLAGLRRLTTGLHKVWRLLTPRRSDDAAAPGDLDRVWRAECDEMDAILNRKDPGRFRK